MGSRPQSLTGVLCEGRDKLFMKTSLSHENNSINVTTFGSSVLLLGQEDKNVMIFYFSSYFSGQKDKSWRSVGEGVDNRWLHSYSNPLRPTPPSHWIYRQITKYNLYEGVGDCFQNCVLVFNVQKSLRVQLCLSNSLSEKVEWNLIAKLLMAQNYISAQITENFSKSLHK